jgi:hypothetical protein
MTWICVLTGPLPIIGLGGLLPHTEFTPIDKDIAPTKLAERSWWRFDFQRVLVEGQFPFYARLLRLGT